jgi:hypothetical protein
VRGGQTAHPRLRGLEAPAGRITQRRERALQSRRDRRAGQLHELRSAAGARRGHHEPDAAGFVRNGVREHHLVVGGDDRRRTRQVHDLASVAVGQAYVEREDGRAFLPEIGDHVQPGGTRRNVDRDQEARCGAQVAGHVR